MKLILMSDTHNYGYPLEKLPAADGIIHAGDACIKGTEAELVNFSRWLDHACAKYSFVIYVPGNHDRAFAGGSQDYIARAICQAGPNSGGIPRQKTNLHILVNESLTIDGVTFFGSPYTRPIGNHGWAYFIDYDGASAFWEMVVKDNPDGYDVLITHDPLYRVGDKVNNNWHHWPFVGCKAIRQYVEELPPALHVFGHIHEGYGIYEGVNTTLRNKKDEPVDTLFVNASIRDETYHVANKPILVTIELIDGKQTVVAAQVID
jgi:hypothetical protein